MFMDCNYVHTFYNSILITISFNTFNMCFIFLIATPSSQRVKPNRRNIVTISLQFEIGLYNDFSWRLSLRYT